MSAKNCAYCGFRFGAFAVNADEIPPLAPLLCESCGEIGMLENGVPRKLADGELEELKQSPAWTEFLAPALRLIEHERGKRS